MLIERYVGQPLPIVIAFPSNPLLVYNKDYVDVVGCVINLKKDVENDADTLYLQKVLGSGVSIDQVNHKFIMELDAPDYANLLVGDSYTIVLAVDIGFTNFVELKVSDNKVKINPDKNRA